MLFIALPLNKPDANLVDELCGLAYQSKAAGASEEAHTQPTHKQGAAMLMAQKNRLRGVPANERDANLDR